MRGKDATDCIAGDEQLLVSWNLERVQARFIASDLPFSSRHLPIPAAIQLQQPIPDLPRRRRGCLGRTEYVPRQENSPDVVGLWSGTKSMQSSMPFNTSA